MRVFRDDARGMIPLWEPEAWLGAPMRRGVIRPKGEHLTATYEPVATAGGARWHHVRLPRNARRADDPAGLHFLSPEDPRLALATTDALPPGIRLGTLLTHRLGSRLVWRGTVEASPGYHRAVAVRLSRRVPAGIVRLPESAHLSAVPRPEARPAGWTADRGHLTLTEWMAGVPLHESLAAPGAHQRALLPPLLRRVGAALAEYHAAAKLVPARAATPAAPVDAAPRNAETEWAAMVELRRSAERYFTAAALRPLDQAASRLRADETAPALTHRPGAALLHGDLHDRQILIDPGSVAFIDLDGAAPGPGELDLGNLAAHLVLRAAQQGRSSSAAALQIAALEEGYAAEAPNIRRDAVLWFRRVALLRLALIYLFRLGPPDLPGRLVEAAEDAATRRVGAA